MPFPDNTPGIDELINLPVGEIAMQPVDLLAAMQREIDAAAKQMKAVTARFSTALEARFATRAAEVRSASGKDTGTVRFDDGDFTIVADLPKRVDWDQDRLAVMVERIRAAVDVVNFKPVCQVGFTKPYNADLGVVDPRGPILRSNRDPDFSWQLVGQLMERQRRGQADHCFRSALGNLYQRRM